MLVIGASGMDIVGRPSQPINFGTSNPGALRTSEGGVARNIAENLARLGMETILMTAVGDDPQGSTILQQAEAAGVDVGPCLMLPGESTGSYLAVLDHTGNLHLALDDMRTVTRITPEHLRARKDLFQQAAMLVLDANLTPDTLKEVVRLARASGVPISADPTSRGLALRLKPHLAELFLITPNEAEAEALCPGTVPHADQERALRAARDLVASGVEVAIITMAEFGVIYATADQSGHIPALRTEIRDPTGAGDALTAAVIFALSNGIPLDEAVRLGISAAALTLRSPGTVRPDLSLELLYDQLL